MSNRTASQVRTAARAAWDSSITVPAWAEVVPGPLGDWVHVWVQGLQVESDGYTCHVPADAERKDYRTHAWLWLPDADQDPDEFAREAGFAVIRALHP